MQRQTRQPYRPEHREQVGRCFDPREAGYPERSLACNEPYRGMAATDTAPGPAPRAAVEGRA